MSDRILKVSIYGGIPKRIICPVCNGEITVNVPIDMPLVHREALICPNAECNKSICLECRG